ncbi:alpha-N-arabinofuranosidase [Solwaraspora sp. WMMD937]|uniref:arabinosylfuranosidase ArfA n=1 Tax=Solwaraspora sp. WMMD937 TaxID=3016090 RepID=UPI00249BB7CB|nr:alpha-N-arabinofuranosidase [Solwaraspora sp. WMMD937]WFE19590.1 alpha-N-arabinofuranosidase [Solwaraspora sp. WMMD937]
MTMVDPAAPRPVTVHIDPAFVVAPVRRRTFGSFVEHMGRCVYTGLYEPDHPTADERGLRRDVLDLVREQGVSVVRYPGGNFVSGYRWEDGVGPRDQRPTRLDPAWHSIETNDFGLDEFVSWARSAGVEPMLAVNLGTRGPREAMDLLEYANHPGGTQLSDLRRVHGRQAPYDIRMWCLGNEMDGPWQLGHQTAEEYGRRAAETARGMRMIDPDLELVVCGSSGPAMPTFAAWEATVLEHTYDQVDYVSAHLYFEEQDGDLASFLASSVEMDRFIGDIVATCDHVRARTRSSKRMQISFDEWNVWYMRRFLAEGVPTEWVRAPSLSEDDYTVADAVVVGSSLITLLRNSDRVTAACQAQLVNTIAAIRAEPGGPAWRQTIFYPFAYTARHARGTVLRVECGSGPVVETARYGEVPLLDVVATHDDDADQLVIFAVNRGQREPLVLDIDLRAFPGYRVVEQCVLTDPDVRAANTSAQPDRVRPQTLPGPAVDQGRLSVMLPSVSWTMVRLATSD